MYWPGDEARAETRFLRQCLLGKDALIEKLRRDLDNQVQYRMVSAKLSIRRGLKIVQLRRQLASRTHVLASLQERYNAKCLEVRRLKMGTVEIGERVEAKGVG